MIAELDSTSRLNLAMQQNAVPLIHRLRLAPADSLRDVTVRVQLEPELSEPWTARFDELAEARILEDIRPVLKPERLINLLESEQGAIRVEVLSEGRRVHEQSWPLEVLAYNEWSGSSAMPELLAAFVMPNHPALEPLLKRAGQLLGEWTGDAALDGYQSKNPNRVRLMAAALYAAVQEHGVSYINPPASFEKTGQKIRTPDQVLEARLGTCLDLTTLMAALLEQAGLNPILVMVQGHAFPGTWLIEHHSQKAFSDDASELLTRQKLGEMCLFDSSAVTQKLPFEGAEEVALTHLGRELVFALDVRACRLRRFRPLPIRLREGFLPQLEPTETIPQAPRGEVPIVATPSGERRALDPAEARLERWKNRLLDLTLRNRLLNYKLGAKSLALLGPPATLENCLHQARARGMQLYPRQDTLPDLAEELGRGRVYVDATETELGKRALELFRTARTTMEETGSNTLYLALGFLRWFETKESERELLAPLLLYPAEIVRGTAREPFRLRLTDEDPRLNSTLLRKLQLDFGLEIAEDLPEDADGVDVAALLQRFRQAIVSVPRWEVVESAQVSLFSFAKYLMWLDLEERKSRLLESPPVARLVSRSGDERPLPEYPRLDEVRPPSECLCLLDADSSQLEAIYHAEDGHSFVIEGPPGTGKSQTITNLIAQMLARGKSVLFVSEKQCALSVVQHRLTQVGLGPFCLELHSNRASRAEVLRQLREATQVRRGRSSQDWELRASQLAELRSGLNAYVEALHRPRALGMTVYQVTGRLCELGPGSRAEVTLPEELSRATFLQWEQEVERLASAMAPLGSVSGHPLTGIEASDWSPDWQERFLKRLAGCKSAWEKAAAALNALQGELSLNPRAPSLTDLERSERFCRNLLATPGEARGLLTGPGWKERRARAEEWIGWAERRAQLWRELEGAYSEKLLELPLASLAARFELASKTSGFVAFFKFWGDRAQLKSARKVKRSYAETLADLQLAREVVELDGRLGQAPAGELFGACWRGWQSDFCELRGRLEWAEGMRADLAWLEDSGRGSGRALELAELGSDLAGRAAGRTLESAREALERLGRELAELESSVDRARAWGDSTERLAESFERWRESQAGLRDWSFYVRARKRVAELGLPAIAALEIPSEQILDAFRRSVLDRWLKDVSAREEVLRSFHGREHSERVARFQALDRQLLDLARRELAARLTASLPDLDNAPGSSEAGVLRGELGKQRRHMPIRRLMQKAPRLVRQLKPCFLMSPLSVAQFLDPAVPAFDLVVFDEASQIPVWDGIGALARGRQAVVVGDSKQLPPTAFFNRGEGEAEVLTEEDYEDLESILNECAAAGLPSSWLRWHYRSRHESLILFSNRQYYEGRLFTFPPALASSPRYGVSLRHVPGVYDRGGSRTNRAEAEAVAREVVRRLTEPSERERTVGVVTFSQPQQVLIEDLLDQARRERPEIEPFFAGEEPVFVKNLENVQGDERDVILFSVGYGPDQQGRVTMNFGPLNREGGERRLNVAVSRARQQVIVFATLRPEQIDLSKVSARGVRDLKTYLEFAARGPSALAAATSGVGADYESPFEEVVARALKARGWEVHAQVGCSGYRVDLGVVDPRAPGRYLAGVECDGASYHSARSARDRDRLREAVLRDLGWELIRVWSTDWWVDPTGQTERVHRFLSERLAATAAPFEVAAGEPVGREVPGGESVERAAPFEVPEEESVEGAAPFEVAEEESVEGAAPFEVPKVSTRYPMNHRGSREEVRKLVAFALERAPVSVREATRMTIEPWGLSRAGSKLQGLVLEAARSLGAREIAGFLWASGQDPASWRGVRAEWGRRLEDVCLEELVNAAEELLGRYGSMPRAELQREIAGVFGYRRVGVAAQARTGEAVERLVREGRARVEGDRILP